MAIAPHSRFTFAEYIALELASPNKHEFLEGSVLAMAGGTPEHAAIGARLARLIGNALEGKPCTVYSSDLRIRVEATGLATYPDLTVICGRGEPDPGDSNTLTNPVLLLEVPSASTAAYDRGEKLAHYQRVPNLQEVLLVAHDCQQLELWQRQINGSWLLHVGRGNDSIQLVSVALSLRATDVYASAF